MGTDEKRKEWEKGSGRDRSGRMIGKQWSKSK